MKKKEELSFTEPKYPIGTGGDNKLKIKREVTEEWIREKTRELHHDLFGEMFDKRYWCGGDLLAIKDFIRSLVEEVGIKTVSKEGDWDNARDAYSGNRIDFTYLMQPPKRYTFEQPKLKKWAEFWSRGKTLNLFAGKVKLNIDETRNDIDPEMPSDYHMDAYEFIKNWKGMKFDTIILDPPYNIRKSREKYEGRYVGSFTKIKDALPKIIKMGSRIITLGYDSVGMSRRRGFKKIAICLVCHSGDHNDTIGLVEEIVGIQNNLFESHNIMSTRRSE